jgi:hypothetical protein
LCESQCRASVDSKTGSECVKSVWVECQQGYSEEDIYTADESGVFYNMTPDSTFTLKGETCVGGKMFKNRLTGLMCVNVTGTDKKTPCYWTVANTALFQKRKEASRWICSQQTDTDDVRHCSTIRK